MLFFTVFPSSAQNTPKTVEERKEWANRVHRKAILKNDSLLLAEAYYLYGKIEMSIPNNYLKARLWFLKSLSILETGKPGFELTRLYLRLGQNELLLKNYEEALTYFKKGIRAAEATQDEDTMAEAYWSLSLFYSPRAFPYPHLNETMAFNPYLNKDSAACYQAKAEKYARPEGRSALILETIKLFKEDMPTAGLEKETEKIGPELAKSSVKTVAHLNLAQRYAREGNLEKARAQIAAAEEAYSRISFSPLLEKSILMTYIDYYEASGNFQKAYSLLKELRQKDHALLVRERNGEISDLEKSFKTGQETLAKELIEMELKLQREKGRLQDKILFFGALSILLLGATVVLLFLLNRKNRQISRQNALLVQEQNHRFNNNLQAVSDLLTLKSEELDIHEAKTVFGESKLLLQSVAALQKKLYSGDKLVSVTLSQMIPEVVDNSLRAFNLTHVKTQYDLPAAEIHAEDALLLNLIITELTTNACKYAFKGTPDPVLSIRMSLSGERLELTFRDNGTSPAQASGRSFGLYLVDLLVKQMQGSYRFYFEEGTVFEMNGRIKTVIFKT